MTKIREKEYSLRELEIETKNAAKAIKEARALRKHISASDPKRKYRFNMQPFFEAERKLYEIEELVSKF